MGIIILFLSLCGTTFAVTRKEINQYKKICKERAVKSCGSGKENLPCRRKKIEECVEELKNGKYKQVIASFIQDCKEKSRSICGTEEDTRSCRKKYFKKCMVNKREEFEHKYEFDEDKKHINNEYYPESQVEEVEKEFKLRPISPLDNRRCMEKAKKECGEDIECQHTRLKSCILKKRQKKRISRERHETCRKRAFEECGVREIGAECRLFFYKNCILHSSPASTSEM